MKLSTFGLITCAVLSSVATMSHATINVTYTDVTSTALSVDEDSIALRDAGWKAYVITATTTGTGINALDMNNSGWGLTGTFHQVWSVEPVGFSTSKGTYTGTTVSSSPYVAAAEGADSGFLITLDVEADAAYEDSTGTGSIISDSSIFVIKNGSKYVYSAGSDYGVGSELTVSGGYYAGNEAKTLDIAYIVVPANTLVTFAARIVDRNNDTADFNVSFNNVPEPATMGMLALAGAGLIARRRR